MEEYGGLRVPARSYSRFSCKKFKLIYTDWANHYLAKSGNKRLIKDLQTDVADGVLLAEIIQVVGVRWCSTGPEEELHCGPHCAAGTVVSCELMMVSQLLWAGPLIDGRNP
ncbi:hypothetical protein KUCAC02_002310 [Chaenocephalus aceratus]|uniref:Uncharacterized protein n=1 Tax=Chaenocephalus aceratus TaxID=36190 RepID=A0ACB9XTY2_CHAAC|nr:hypothetical protein KUCAC02_002310 [Chaenocephalus aceratus]